MHQEDINFSVFRSFSFSFASGQNEVSSISIALLLWILKCPAWGCQTWNFSCKNAWIQCNFFGLFCNYILGNWCLEAHPATVWLVTSAVSCCLNKRCLGWTAKPKVEKNTFLTWSHEYPVALISPGDTEKCFPPPIHKRKMSSIKDSAEAQLHFV